MLKTHVSLNRNLPTWGGGGGGCKEWEWHISYVESEHSRIFELREQRFLSGMAAIMHENVRSKNSSANDLERNQKTMPKILGDLFRVKSVKNGQLYHILDVRKSLERQASKQFYNKYSENSRSQIVFRTENFWPLVNSFSRKNIPELVQSRQTS